MFDSFLIVLIYLRALHQYRRGTTAMRVSFRLLGTSNLPKAEAFFQPMAC
jgi:hypothetical protein